MCASSQSFATTSDGFTSAAAFLPALLLSCPRLRHFLERALGCRQPTAVQLRLFCCWLPWRSRCHVTIVRRSQRNPQDFILHTQCLPCPGGPLYSQDPQKNSLLLPCSALPPEGWANDRSCWLWFPVEITPRSQSEVAGRREWSTSLLSIPPPSGWPFWLVFLTTPVCLLGHSLAAPSGLSQEEKQRSYGATQASQQALHSPSGVALLLLSTQRHLAGNLRILNTLKVACLF